VTRVTVAICTWNRAPLLGSALESLRALELPQDLQLELLVVDNGSSDETPAVLREYAGALPLRAVCEPEPGLSHARNRAVAEARGELLIWIDDDVRVEPGWLAAYLEASRQHPDASFFGGATLPWFERPPPAWIAGSWELLADVWAIRLLPPEPAPVDPGRLPVGANFAIRTAVQRRHAYDPRLGRRREEPTGGEETAVLRRLLAQGDTGWWVPDARVRHWIPAQRLAEPHLRRIWFGQGCERALTRGGAPRPRLRLLARALRAEARYRVARRLGEPAKWLRELERAQNRWGELSASPR
jgi:glycosyltransferase involved in cell wall biosynthesis